MTQIVLIMALYCLDQEKRMNKIWAGSGSVPVTERSGRLRSLIFRPLLRRSRRDMSTVTLLLSTTWCQPPAVARASTQPRPQSPIKIYLVDFVFEKADCCSLSMQVNTKSSYYINILDKSLIDNSWWSLPNLVHKLRKLLKINNFGKNEIKHCDLILSRQSVLW